MVAVLVVVVVALAVTRFDRAAGRPASAGTQVATTTRTNVIVILTDDQNSNTLWAMPHLQSLLVKHGVTFANSFVSDSLCCPSRASILTGNYAHTTKVYDNHPPNGGAFEFQRTGDQNSTIATWLKAGGYDTGLFGKYLNAYRGGVPPGWDRWVSFETVGHRADGTGAYPEAAAYTEYSVYTNHAGRVQDGRRIRASCRTLQKQYSTTYFGNAATRFIDTAPASKPVFVYYAPYAPHCAVGSAATLRAQLPPSEALPPARLQRGERLGQAALDPRPAPVRPCSGSADRCRPAGAVPDVAHGRQRGRRDRAPLRQTHRLAHSVILYALGQRRELGRAPPVPGHASSWHTRMTCACRWSSATSRTPAIRASTAI